MAGALARPSTAAGQLAPSSWALLAIGAAGLARGLEVLAGGFRPAGVLPVSTGVALALALVGVALWNPASPAPGRYSRGRRLRRAIVLGGLCVLGIQALAHLLQVVAVALASTAPTLLVEGLNPVTGSDRYVGVYLAVGVVLAALAEELLFRGLLLGTLARRLSFHRANAVQGALFGCWHLAWPLALAVGPLEAPVALPILAAGTVLVTGLVGAVFGAFVRRTATLWTAVLAHVLHNGVAVFVHVRAAGVDRADVLAPALVVGYATLAWVVWRRWE